MRPRLFAGRWDTARTSLQEFIEHPAQIRARCSLNGWLQRLEITVKARSKWDAYERYQEHPGDGFAIFDRHNRPVIDGWCYEVVPDNRHVTYIVGGGWKRMTDRMETTEPSAPTDDTDVYLKSVLTAHAPAINSDQSGIVGTGTDIGESFDLRLPRGRTPQEIANYITQAGTASNYILDFWLRSALFDATALQDPLPFLQVRKTQGEYNWQIERRDLADMSFSRNIWDLANYVKMYFTWTTNLSGAHSAGATALTVDSIANFGVGDEIEIELNDGKRFRTSLVSSSGSTLNINEDLPHTAPDDGVVWRRQPLQDTSVAQDTDSQSDYWTREYVIEEREVFANRFDTTQADQIRDGILADFKDPVQKNSFTIGAPTIRTKDGAEWPTWWLLHSPGYLRINDLYPSASIANLDTLNATSVFFTHSLDYDHNSRRMRVTPDAFFGDNRLDVLLQKLGMRVGQGVQA